MSNYVYVDVTGVLEIKKMSGVPRVVLNVLKEILLNEELNFKLIRYIDSANKFYLVNNNDFYNNIFVINKSNVRSSSPIDLSDFAPGDVFMDIDAVWNSKCLRNRLYPILKSMGVKIVSFIYDIIPIVHPEFSITDIIYRFIPYFGASIQYSDYMIVNTHNTKNDIQNLCSTLGIQYCNIEVVPLSCNINEDKTSALRDEIIKIAANGRYMLQVGTIEPRKNHNYVLDAVDKGLGKLDINYIIAGHIGWSEDGIVKRIKKHKLYNKKIFLITDSSDRELSYLYRNAYLSVFPSLYEGYGLPIVEALLHGVPVFTSDIAGLREVGGEYCDYFSLSKPKALVELVSKYLNDANMYEIRKKKVLEFSPLTWAEVGNRVSDILTNTINMKVEANMHSNEKLTVTEVINILNHADKSDTTSTNIDMTGNRRISDLNIGSLDEPIKALNKNYSLSYYKPIHSYRKLIGKLIIFVKKVIRKSVKWLVEPSLNQQTEFNAACTEIINDLRNKLIVIEANQESIVYKEELARLKQDLLVQEGKITEYSNKIAEQEDKITVHGSRIAEQEDLTESLMKSLYNIHRKMKLDE